MKGVKKYERATFTDRIKWRLRILWASLIFMLVYMIFVGETGGGDSRIVTRLADFVGDIIFFGGLAYIIYRIRSNRRLLQNRRLLEEKLCLEQDERNQYLHDKSGGIVMDALMLVMLFVTMTTAAFNMAAFYASFAILTAAVLLKASVYLFYSRR